MTIKRVAWCLAGLLLLSIGNLYLHQRHSCYSAQAALAGGEIDEGAFQIGQCLRRHLPFSPWTQVCRARVDAILVQAPALRGYIDAAHLARSGDFTRWWHNAWTPGVDPHPGWAILTHVCFLLFMAGVLLNLYIADRSPVPLRHKLWMALCLAGWWVGAWLA